MQAMDSAPQDDSVSGDDEDLLKSILKNIRESRTHFAEWRKDAKEDYDFYAGKQWDEDDVQVLNEQKRPPVTFNRTARTVNSVAGLEVQNRQEVRYYPRKIVDPQEAGATEMLTDASKWVRDECDAEDEESESFQDSLICGMGWTETRLDYECYSDGMVVIERGDPLEFGVDHTAKKRNCEDSKFRYRIKTYSRAEFKDKWPDADVPKVSFFDTEDADQLTQDLTPGGYSPLLNNEIEGDRKTIQVCQYQYYNVTKFHMVQDESGQMVEMPVERFKQARSMLDEKGLKYTREAKPKRKYMQCFITAESILDKSDNAVNDFTLHCITGLRDRNKNTWFGIVRMMKDPQRWANKWLSQIQHILNTNAKSGKLLWETGAFKNAAKAKQEWSSPDAMAELNAGGLAKVEQLNAAAYPDGIDRLLQYAMSAINDVPGVNLELMGLANRDQANVLEQSRKQAGVTILAVFFDALRRYRKKQGRTLADFIINYISDGRLIRITGDQGQQFVPLIRDPSFMEYDVVVDDAPSSPNMKERVFAALQAILPVVMKEGIPVPPELLDYTPLPQGLIQSWKQHIQEQGQNPEMQQQKQMQQQAMMADTAQKASAAKLNDAKAQAELAKIGQPEQITPTLDPAMELRAQSALQMEEIRSKEQLELVKIQSKEKTDTLKILANAQAQIETAKITASMSNQSSQEVKGHLDQTNQALGGMMEGALSTLSEAIKSMGQMHSAPKEFKITRSPDGTMTGESKPKLN